MRMTLHDIYVGITIVILLVIMVFFTVKSYGQSNNDLMQVTVSIEVPDDGQFDQDIAHHSIEALTNSNDIVECLATLYDTKPEIILKDLSVYIQTYIQTIEFAGYTYKAGEDIVYKTVYFNKHGYIIPYECAVAQLKGNETKVMRDDEYQRVYHYNIED
jgi:hypothetical protein